MTAAVHRPWVGARQVLVEALADTLLPWLPLLLAATLYSWQLGAAPLWYDESGSVWMAELPLARLVAATAGDTHPPLYFILLSGVQRVLGSGPVAMRLPSVLCALAALALTLHLARAFQFTPAAQLITALILLASPFQLHFAQEARMYTLLQVEVLAMVLTVLRRQWGWFGLAAAAALWTHNYGLIYLAAIGAWALWREFNQPLGLCQADRLIAAGGLAGLSWLPWAAVLAGQMATIAGGYWITPLTPGGVVYVIYTWLFTFTLPDWAQPMGVLVSCGLVLWLLAHSLRARGAGLALAWLVLAPLAAVVVVSLVWRSILLFRGFAPAAPLVGLWCGWAFAGLAAPRRWYGLVLVIPLMLASVVGHYVWNVDHKSSIYTAAVTIAEQWQPGDVLVHANEGTLVEMHPITGDRQPQVVLPRCARPNLGALSPATQAALGITAADPAALAWDRLWFVWSWPPTVTQCEVDQALAFLRTYRPRQVMVLRDDAYIYATVWLVTR